ncbi:A disintegrin and metalloproteinase with thrombospondin motifs 7-like isoform X1 [Linepithema humile]|uniref:A disintegrin and metalloproteinase with thrombospondin motifs 7-like isoform X1 n=1 Tax=Linepithema humile TaxID=83485 RepID=UPI00351DFA36
MFFLQTIKVLIILLNEANAYITQDTEIILLPASNPTGAEEIPLTLKVFGELIHLNLRQNDRIVSSEFEVWNNNAKSVTAKLLQLNVSDPCYYYHKDHISSAAINFCHEYGWEGLVFVENDTLEIRPLWNEFTSLFLIDDFREQTNLSFGKPHLIKRSLQYFADSNFYHWDNSKLKRHRVRNAQQKLIIELVIFLDAAAYQTFKPLVKNNKQKMNQIIKAYVNRIEAAFNDLDVLFDISLVHIHILENQPLALPVFGGDIEKLLDSFCEYANVLNPPDDNDPHHWDIALYLTGLNLYEHLGKILNRKMWKNYTVTGNAYQDGACKPLLSCAIVEFRNNFETQSSRYISLSTDAVFKIGHLLGLAQDQNYGVAKKYDDKFMNSAGPTFRGMITWSEDSRNKIKKVWERKKCLRDDTRSDKTGEQLIIELAVFVDETAYRKFLPLLDNDEKKLHNIVLAYVNQIQAVFHHPSLGVSLDIMLVHLYIMNKQPSNLIISGDVDKVLDSFCKYANSLNPPDDNDPGHWDISLYLTGKNLYEFLGRRLPYKRGKRLTDFTTGLTYVDEVCSPQNSCAVVEFGAVFESLTSGFSSSLSALHLIGHLIGLEFDRDPFESYNNADNVNIPVMSPYRYFRGHVTWSKRSRNKIERLWERKPCLRDDTTSENITNAYALDHSRYHELPGREWTAKAQCELYLGDKNANVVTLHDICQTLQCETPRRTYFAGPALEGSSCALGKECRGGECVPVIEPPYIFKYCEDDNWSEWKKDSCRSSCLAQSKGVVVKRRSCKHGINKSANCIELYYDVVLCNDSLLCTQKRMTIAEFTTIKCTEFKDIMSDLHSQPGYQGHYYNDRPWIACTIFCKRKNFSYSSVEMIANGVNPYFPDGTLCHKERNKNYYCRKHHCVPENYEF